MLDLVEKITAGACAFLILVTLGVYLFFGAPSTTANEFVPAVEKRQSKPQGPKQPGEPIPADEQAIVEKLAEQGIKLLPGKRLARDEYTVPEKTLEHLSTEANWGPEIRKAQSSLVKVGDKTTRLKIYDIEEGSMLQKLGLKENDTIDLIDCNIVEFKPTNTLQYHDMFKSAVKKLRSGETVSVTVTRNNQPVHLEFKL